MVAQTKTKLSLSRWAEIMGIHPLHFNNVYLEDVDLHCTDVWLQHSWQTADHVSREELALAIAEAESNIESLLGYRLAPSWEVDEWRETIRPFIPDLINRTGYDIRGMRQTVQAKWGYMISGGIESKSVIEAASNITYSDVNNDGYFETATVMVTSDVQDKQEICVFYPGHDGDDAWEIRPINVVIGVGGAITITFRRELAVKEDLIEDFDADNNGIIGTDDDNFLTEVDVYRRYNDPQLQAAFLWEPFAYNCNCGGTGCSDCAYGTQNGCLTVRGDPRQSIVGYWPADWNSDTLEFDRTVWSTTREPDIVRLYYYAGWRNKSGQYLNRMDPKWERTVAYYAASLLDREPCSCCKGAWDKWHQDLALVTGSEELGIFGDTKLENPLGTTRGAVNAYRRLRNNLEAPPILAAVSLH